MLCFFFSWHFCYRFGWMWLLRQHMWRSQRNLQKYCRKFSVSLPGGFHLQLRGCLWRSVLWNVIDVNSDLIPSYIIYAGHSGYKQLKMGWYLRSSKLNHGLNLKWQRCLRWSSPTKYKQKLERSFSVWELRWFESHVRGLCKMSFSHLDVQFDAFRFFFPPYFQGI